jgi:hypothetical protein
MTIDRRVHWQLTVGWLHAIGSQLVDLRIGMDPLRMATCILVMLSIQPSPRKAFYAPVSDFNQKHYTFATAVPGLHETLSSDISSSRSLSDIAFVTRRRRCGQMSGARPGKTGGVFAGIR